MGLPSPLHVDLEAGRAVGIACRDLLGLRRALAPQHLDERLPVAREAREEGVEHRPDVVPRREGTTVDERLIIRIDVDQGEVIAYASVVDDATGESVFVGGVPVVR